MTAADKFLAEVRARSVAATPGPWESFDSGPWGGEGAGVAIGPNVYDWFTTAAPTTEQRANDSHFIAHTRTDVDRLVAMVEAARKALDESCDDRHGCGPTTRHCPSCVAKRELDRIAGGGA